MFKEYKPSEKCYISDLLQINKIIAAAPCGTERDINQQENDLYKTISAAYHKIIQNLVENGGRIFTQSPNYLHANFFQNNAKCTYFHPKMYLRRQKMYLVNNVLENRIGAVPLLIC